MDSLIPISNILKELSIFPDVLNYIILEFIMTEHTFRLKKTIDKLDIYKYSKFCINGNNMYTIIKYSKFCINGNNMHTIINNQSLEKRIINNDQKINILNVSKRMDVYKNKIYVMSPFDKYTGYFIYVFNDKCEKIMNITSPYPNDSKLYVLDDKIYTYCRDDSIHVLDLSGQCVNKITIPETITDEGIYSVKIYDNNIYVLTDHEIIYKYSPNGCIIDRYNLHKTLRHVNVFNFFVVDNIIYFNNQYSFEIFQYVGDSTIITHDINKNCERIDGNYPQYLALDDDILYVSDFNYSNIRMYDVTKKNIMKLIK